MAFFGNIFTHYNYTTTDIKNIKNRETHIIKSSKSKLDIVINNSNSGIELPKGSPFSNWEEARRFAGPLPFTFTYNKKAKEMLIIEGVRQNWKPKPIKVESYDIAFLNSLNLNDYTLANAFIIKNIPYYWKKGKIDT